MAFCAFLIAYSKESKKKKAIKNFLQKIHVKSFLQNSKQLRKERAVVFPFVFF
jgi:hypothetical protein